MTEARLGGCGPVVRAGPHLGGGPDFERPAPTLPVGPRGRVSATASACGGHLHLRAATASGDAVTPPQVGLGRPVLLLTALARGDHPERASFVAAPAPGNLRCRPRVARGKIVDGGQATRGRPQLNRGMTGFDFGGYYRGRH